jgi:hypothetical protein
LLEEILISQLHAPAGFTPEENISEKIQNTKAGGLM